MKKWAFDPKNDENRPKQFMMSQRTNQRGKKKPRLVPDMLRDDSKPLQMVHNGAKLRSTLVPKRSKMVPDSYKKSKFNKKSAQRKNNRCISWKNGHLTPKTQSQQGFWGQMAIFSPTTSIFFFRGCTKSCKEAIERKKSGCHP